MKVTKIQPTPTLTEALKKELNRRKEAKYGTRDPTRIPVLRIFTLFLQEPFLVHVQKFIKLTTY